MIDSFDDRSEPADARASTASTAALVTDNQDPHNLGRISAQGAGSAGRRGNRLGVAGAALLRRRRGRLHGARRRCRRVDRVRAGDVSRPIWTGCWWGSGQLPKDETGAATTPARKIIRTEQGLLLAFDDGGKTIALSDSNGSNLLKIEVQQGQIKMQAATKVVVEAPQIELVQSATHPLVFGDNLLDLSQSARVDVQRAHASGRAGRGHLSGDARRRRCRLSRRRRRACSR